MYPLIQHQYLFNSSNPKGPGCRLFIRNMEDVSSIPVDRPLPTLSGEPSTDRPTREITLPKRPQPRDPNPGTHYGGPETSLPGMYVLGVPRLEDEQTEGTGIPVDSNFGGRPSGPGVQESPLVALPSPSPARTTPARRVDLAVVV